MERDHDAAIDRWNDGALDALRGRPEACPDSDYLKGYAHGLDQRKVCVIMPPHPEGYYHMPLGSLD